MTDWRDDPDWTLVDYDEAAFPDGPPTRPPPEAELAQPDSWATLYRLGRPAATWTRLARAHRPG